MGFQVWYKIRHSGYTKQAYWASDIKDADYYAAFVLKNHGHYCEVYIIEE